MTMLARLFLAGAVTVAVTGCTDDGAAERITVSAAAVLTDAFVEIERAYETEHPDVDLMLNVAGSSALVAQVQAGAPVDLVALASVQAMKPLIDDGSVHDAVPFASTSMVIAVPRGNPAGIADVRSLNRRDVTWVMCDVQVPCGTAARDVLASSGVTAAPVSFEPDVRAVLAKVVADEVDAGIVYRTDVIAARDSVDAIGIPEADNVRLQATIAATEGARPAADEFIEFVRSDAGQGILASYGFEAAS